MDTGPSPNTDHRRLDDLRRGRGPIQEHVIDEFVAGRLSRRDFLRRGSAIGLSMPLIGGILAACGSSGQSPGQTPKGKAGGTIKAGILVPAAAINPITIADQGGLELIGNVGEFLVFTDQHGNYHPWLAESWTPNADSSVWTFKIRQGVKFNDGTPMPVDDVVYSFQTQSDPKSKANALSVFGGILDPSGVKKVNDTTVAFHLQAPDGGFVDAVSEDNYNMIIVPKGFDYSTYQTTWPARRPPTPLTGPPSWLPCSRGRRRWATTAPSPRRSRPPTRACPSGRRTWRRPSNCSPRPESRVASRRRC